MIRPVAALAAVLFVVVVVRSAEWAATRVLWGEAGAMVLGAVALALWHRQKMAELRELESSVMGQWRRVSLFVPWPKTCTQCGTTVHDWRSLKQHGNPDQSACAAFRTRMEAAERAPGEPWTAVVEASGEERRDDDDVLR